MLAAAQLRVELRRLLAGPRTSQAAEEAGILIAAYTARQDAPQPVRRLAEPLVVLTPAQAWDAREKAKWARFTRGSAASAVITPWR